MREKVILVQPEGATWRVEAPDRHIGRYRSREAAFTAAVAAARRSRAAGCYVWVKVRHPPAGAAAQQPRCT